MTAETERCTVVTLSGQCPGKAVLVRHCQRHFDRQRELVKAGKTLVLVIQNYDLGLDPVVEK